MATRKKSGAAKRKAVAGKKKPKAVKTLTKQLASHPMSPIFTHVTLYEQRKPSLWNGLLRFLGLKPNELHEDDE